MSLAGVFGVKFAASKHNLSILCCNLHALMNKVKEDVLMVQTNTYLKVRSCDYFDKMFLIH